MVDKYEKDLEKNCRDQVIMLDRVKVTERKLSDSKAVNATSAETNSSFTEVNERLTDECAVKEGKIQSLNDLLSQARQEAKKHKAKLAQKCWENNAMTLELSELVDDEGKLLPHIKDELIMNFCESTDGDTTKNKQIPTAVAVDVPSVQSTYQRLSDRRSLDVGNNKYRQSVTSSVGFCSCIC